MADSVAKVGGAPRRLRTSASVDADLGSADAPHRWFYLGRRRLRSELRRARHQLGQTSQVLGDRRQHELVLRAPGATQTKPAEPQDALQVREPHLYAFALAPRLLEGFGPGKGSGDIAGRLVDTAGNLAGRSIGTASSLQRARGAVPRAAAIKKRGPVIHKGAARRQGLPAWADIGVGARVVVELLAREGTVLSLGLVDDGDVRRDLLVFDQPVQHRRRSIGGVRREPLRLEPKSHLGALQHGPGRANLGLANGA